MEIQQIIASLRINKFTIIPTGPRCEMWAVFFVSLRISHFKADFRPLNGLGGTSYHLWSINAPNRIFGQFYFFEGKSEKIKKKLLVIKNKLLPLHRG